MFALSENGVHPILIELTIEWSTSFIAYSNGVLLLLPIVWNSTKCVCFKLDLIDPYPRI